MKKDIRVSLPLLGRCKVRKLSPRGGGEPADKQEKQKREEEAEARTILSRGLGKKQERKNTVQHWEMRCFEMKHYLPVVPATVRECQHHRETTAPPNCHLLSRREHRLLNSTLVRGHSHLLGTHDGGIFLLPFSVLSLKLHLFIAESKYVRSFSI